MKRIQTASERKNGTNRGVCFLLAGCALPLLLAAPGCGNKFFDPTQVGRFRPVPAVNVILNSLGVAEEAPVAWEQAEDPKPTDTMVVDTDYVFMSGDTVRISIFELFQEGVEFVNEYTVNETGKISIPEVGVLEAAGLSETQVEDEIRQILSPSILKEPSVLVTLVRSQQRTFSIIGDGIAASGRYVIPRYDFKLTDALAIAGGPRQFNVSNIYVARAERPREAGARPVEPDLDLKLVEPQTGDSKKAGQNMLEIIAPRAQRMRAPRPGSRVVISSSEMATEGDISKVTFSGAAGNSGGLKTSAVRSGLSGSSAEATVKDVAAQPGKEESVSVKDILKSLADRSGQQSGDQEPVGVADAGPVEVKTGRPMPSLPVAQKQSDVSAVGKSRPGRLPSAALDERAGSNGGVSPAVVDRRAQGAEDVSVDDLLRRLSEPSGQEKSGSETQKEDVLKSLAEPGEEPKEDESPGIDATLKALSDQGLREGAAEQKVPRDVEVEIAEPSEAAPPTTEKTENVEAESGRIEWVFQDGKWIPVQIGQPKPMEPVIKTRPEGELVAPGERQAPVADWVQGGKVRLIRVPADKLLAGDPRYNIVVKSGDSIYVPVDVIGEFCIMGNVNNQGYIPITGRPMTLKMAIAAAGGLGPLAWPKRVEVIRRIGKEKEEVVLVDLDKIASGEQPDFFIKPHDLINVGTHATSTWRYVLRNAFRATYGFGFIYDRNFADRDYGNSPWPF